MTPMADGAKDDWARQAQERKGRQRAMEQRQSPGGRQGQPEQVAVRERARGREEREPKWGEKQEAENGQEATEEKEQEATAKQGVQQQCQVEQGRVQQQEQQAQEH